MLDALINLLSAILCGAGKNLRASVVVNNTNLQINMTVIQRFGIEIR